MDVCDIRHLPLSRLLERAPQSRRAHILCPVGSTTSRANASSTNLDSWSLVQLRTLKVGGNGALKEFFQKHGGTSLLPPGNSDARTRYSSRTAQLYKEELARRIAEDAREYPDGIHIDGVDLTPMATQTSTPANESPNDFFDTWDKAEPTPSPRPSRPSSTAPPSIGVPRATPTPPPGGTTSSTSSAPAAGPRTVSSASLRTAPTARPAASRLASGPKASKLGASKLGGSKLGAKKAGTAINFEEAQRKALEEEERIKRLGYDKKKEEEEAAALKAREEEERRKNQAAGVNNSRSATPLSSQRKAAVEDKPVPVRLGFGQTMSTAQPAKPAAASSSRHVEDDDDDGAAKARFGNQKGISSDMYFNRGNYDAEAASQAQGRLQQFQGATAISSNQYFGRDEDEDDEHEGGGDGMLGLDGNETMQNLERNIQDMAHRVMANPDVQQLTDQIRAGALKVGGLRRGLC